LTTARLVMSRRSVFLASLVVAAAVPCGAQAPAPSAPAVSAPASEAAASPTQPSTPAASATASKAASAAADASSAEPSPEVIREARREGFKPKKRNGVTLFCYTDKSTGTHFETEKCFDQYHMEMLVHQRQDQRNQLGQSGACGGTNCSGH